MAEEKSHDESSAAKDRARDNTGAADSRSAGASSEIGTEALSNPGASPGNAATSMEVGQVWHDGARDKTWTVTRVGKRKVHLRAELPEFTATATAWIDRVLASKDWKLVGE